MRIRVTAPASTANIGPGFDCIGAALSLRVTVDVRSQGASAGLVHVTSPSGDEPPSPDLVFRAAEAVAGELPMFAGEIEATVPVGRGLGSSAAAIAAGLLLGCACAGREPEPAALLALGLPLEGHPDNLAPALYGGLTLCVPAGDGYDVLRVEPSPSVRPRILVPDERLPTSEARRALPERVPHADAVANVARAAGLMAVLGGAAEPTVERLLACTDDRLHQPYRAGLMPRTAGAITSLRGAGVPAAVSGAGPSIVCLVTDEIQERFRAATAGMAGWTVLDCGWDLAGARIEEMEVEG